MRVYVWFAILSSVDKDCSSLTPLTPRVGDALARDGLLRRGDRVLVALSGGPDSVALLLTLLELRPALALEVRAAHVNHGLRGEESDRDEDFVGHLCGQQGVPLASKRVETRSRLQEQGGNLEACARRLRYEFLFQTALEDGCTVATGHTLNDQAETFLMKLVRGAGPAGLSGISPRRVNRLPGGEQEVTVIRPLLGIPRKDVLFYLERCGQDYCRDLSNQDLELDRNWVRHRLIPLLEERLNPNLLGSLRRTVELCREVNLRLEREGDLAFDHCSLGAEAEPRLHIPRVLELDPARQRQLIRRAVEVAGGDLGGITFSHVDAVREILRSHGGKELHLPGGLRVRREFEELLFTHSGAPSPFCYRTQVPGEVRVCEVGKTVRFRRIGSQGAAAGAATVRFQGDHLTVRSRRPGDRYRSDGPRSAEKKLKELFQRRRIPRSQRDRLVLIEGCGRLLWVEGFPSQAPEDEAEMVEIQVRPETSAG